MATDESQRIVERHITVAEGNQLLASGVLDHDLRMADLAHAKLHGTPAPEPSPCKPPAPTAVASEPVVVSVDTVRSQLGLG
jgi:hypothetical protein